MAVGAHNADCLLLSALPGTRVAAVGRTVRAVHQTATGGIVRILVDGAAFRPAREPAGRQGADACAETIGGAVEVAGRLVGMPTPPSS